MTFLYQDPFLWKTVCTVFALLLTLLFLHLGRRAHRRRLRWQELADRTLGCNQHYYVCAQSHADRCDNWCVALLVARTLVIMGDIALWFAA